MRRTFSHRHTSALVVEHEIDPPPLERVARIIAVGRMRQAVLVLDPHHLTDAAWARQQPLLADQTLRRGGRCTDHRMVINEVFWRTRCGLRWRDVPPVYGSWKTGYNGIVAGQPNGTEGGGFRRAASRR